MLNIGDDITRVKGEIMRGNGSITKSGKSYLAQFSSNGIRTSKRCKTEQEANNWLAKCKAESAVGNFIVPTAETLGDWAIQYLETYSKPKVKYKTYIRYVETAEMLAPITGIKLSDVNSMTLQKFVHSFATQSQKHKVYDFLNRILKKASALRMIPFNPMEAVDAPHYEPKKLETFTDDEIKRIKLAIQDRKERSFVLTAFATGCRIAELCGLTIDNVHEDYIHIQQTVQRKAGGWFIETPKTANSIRDIPVPKSIIGLIKAEYQKEPLVLHGFVFHKDNGEPLLPDWIQRRWKEDLRMAGVPYRNFHYIRHTHATNLLHKFDMVEVQHRLGHSLASTTLDMYGHTKQEYTQDIVNEVEKMIN